MKSYLIVLGLMLLIPITPVLAEEPDTTTQVITSLLEGLENRTVYTIMGWRWDGQTWVVAEPIILTGVGEDTVNIDIKALDELRNQLAEMRSREIYIANLLDTIDQVYLRNLRLDVEDLYRQNALLIGITLINLVFSIVGLVLVQAKKN